MEKKTLKSSRKCPVSVCEVLTQSSAKPRVPHDLKTFMRRCAKDQLKTKRPRIQVGASTHLSVGQRFPPGHWEPGLEVRLQKSLQPVILLRCRSELSWLPAVLPLSLPVSGIILPWCHPCVSGWAHPGCLVLRHPLSQSCPSPLCYPLDLSWSLWLSCLFSSFLVSLLFSSHWPHLKATSGLSSSLDTTLRLPLSENHPLFLSLNFSEEPWEPWTNVT